MSDKGPQAPSGAGPIPWGWHLRAASVSAPSGQLIGWLGPSFLPSCGETRRLDMSAGHLAPQALTGPR